ncbi:MAG: hypothetical protein J4G03_01610 [Gemmatimonadetes bacterium]|nr:hypothetical protein [Gemmatimonadota bacterium]
MTSPKHLKLSVVALVSLAVGGGYGDPVDPAGDVDPEDARDTVRPAAAMTGQLDVLDSVYWNTGGANWNDNTNWLTDEPLGDWYSVSADTQGNVTRLSLYDNDLAGSIPAKLGGLDSLRYLNFSSNDFTGSIPAELGNLVSLRGLNLSSNGLTGSIPAELGNLESLWGLLLQGNSGLTGPLPDDLTGTTPYVFHWYDTGLCAPTDAAFQAWLDSIPDEQGAGDCS